MGKSVAAAAVGVLSVYLLLLTRSHYWDGVLFSLYVEKVAAGEMARTALFHPNHLFYSAAGFVLYDMFSSMHLRAITCFQVWSAVCGAATAALVGWLAAGWTGSRWTMWFCTVLFAFGATWWKFSTDAASYVPAVLLVALAVRGALGGRWVEAAVYHAAAMTVHQLAVFAFIPIAFATAARAGRGRAAAYAGTAMGLTSAAYLLTFYGAGLSTGTGFFAWLTSFSGGAQTTHTIGQVLGTYPLSYGKLLFGGKFGLIWEFWSFPVAAGLAGAVGLLVLGSWLLARKEEGGRGERDPVVTKTLWLWIAPYAVFTLWFEPGNAFYKLFLWPPAVLLAGLTVRQRAKAGLAFALAMTAWNFGAFIYPHTKAAADPVYAFALRLDRELPREAKVFYRQFTSDDWYLAYFAPGRNWRAAPMGNLAKEAPFCLETSALGSAEVEHAGLRVAKSWLLDDRRHYVQVKCYSNMQ